MFAQGKARGRNSFGNELPIGKIKNIIRDAKSVTFPWDAIPTPIKPWLKAMGGAINTQPEFLLIGALTVTSCLMGPECVFQVRERHLEQCNLFTLCLCEPGTGKTQAYKVAVETPLKGIPTPVIMHEYTAKGLFDHLQTRGGRALLCHAEMSSFYETLMKRQSEGNGERQLFCRLHDGDTNMIRTIHGNSKSSSSQMKKQDSRTVIEKTCMAIGGFCQPQPFIYLYHMLGMLDDGFTDRISMCIIKSIILKESEIEEWNVKLNSFKIAQFDEIYAAIYDEHQIPRTYTFSDEARTMYVQFSDNIVQDMNNQLEEDIILSDNLSKDRKIFIRLCAVIHVLFTVMEFVLDETNEEELVIPLHITKDTAIMAKAFVEYFASQRRAMNKIKNSCPPTNTGTSSSGSTTKSSLSDMEIDNEKKEDIYEIICEVIVKACQLESSPEMFQRFVRKTKLQHQEAIAIRWEELPEDKSRISKNLVFAKLSKHLASNKLSDKRLMKQKDGSSKAVRCIIIHKCSFSETLYAKLEKVIPELSQEADLHSTDTEASTSTGNVTEVVVINPLFDIEDEEEPVIPKVKKGRNIAEKLEDSLSKNEIVYNAKRQCR